MLSKSFWTLFVAALTITIHTGCSSGGPEGESEAFAEMEAAEADFLGEGGDAFAEGGGDEFGDLGESWDNAEAGDDLAAEFAEGDDWSDDFGDDFSDEFAEEGQTTTAEAAPLSDEFTGEFSDEDFGDEFADEFAFDAGETAPPAATETAGSELGADEFGAADFGDEFASSEPTSFEDPFEGVESTEAPLDPLLPAETSYDIGSYDSGDINSQLGLVPVKKVKTEPYWRNGRLLNSVYIGRPGDMVSSVSLKIFGVDKSSEIVADNPWLSKGITVGEKLYYSSPNRPDDNTVILTYYEDTGVPFETYSTQTGDNIRVVSSRLLGFEGAWKEVWATNPEVMSKEEVTAGLQLRYWPSMGAPVPIPVASAPAPADPQMDIPPMDEGSLEAADLPPVNQAANTGTTDMSSMGEPTDQEIIEPMDMMEPPPLDPIAEAPPIEIPEPEMAAAPAPPAPPAPPRPPQRTTVGGGADNTLKYVLGCLLMVLIAVAIARMVKRKRAPSLEYTQV